MRRFLGPRGAAVVAVAAIVMLVAGVLIQESGGSGSTASAATPVQQIGMRVLLITDSSDPTTASGIAYGDWVSTLKREGVPYDSVVTSDASPGSVALPTLSSTLANGNEVGQLRGRRRGGLRHSGPQQRPVDSASDLRATLRSAPGDGLRRPQR